MKRHFYLFFLMFFISCGDDDSGAIAEEEEQKEEKEKEEINQLTDDFEGSGPLVGYVTNNASALPDVNRMDGRYTANLTDNINNITLHYHEDQGRLDAKLVAFPFEFVARNIGIGTQEDSQTAQSSVGDPFNFAGVQVHVEDLNTQAHHMLLLVIEDLHILLLKGRIRIMAYHPWMT